MQFTPDTRNLGGRFMILSHAHCHRLCLQQIKERQYDTSRKSPLTKRLIDNSAQKRNQDHNMQLHKNRIKEIQQCATDRGQSPTYFFRRLPSPQSQYLKLLYKRPLNYKSQSINSEKFKTLKIEPTPVVDTAQFVPQSARSKVEWSKLVASLNGPKTPLKEWIKQLAFSYQIYDDSDFAILIRLLLFLYNLKKQALINIVADIIEELEH